MRPREPRPWRSLPLNSALPPVGTRIEARKFSTEEPADPGGVVGGDYPPRRLEPVSRFCCHFEHGHDGQDRDQHVKPVAAREISDLAHALNVRQPPTPRLLPE